MGSNDATNISKRDERIQSNADSMETTDSTNIVSSIEQLQSTEWSDFGFGRQLDKSQARKKASRLDSDEDDWWFLTTLRQTGHKSNE